MRFAHWKNMMLPTGVVTGPYDEHRREVGRDEVAEQFIEDIPDGTTRNDVVAKLFASGVRIDETDGLGFEEEWPPEVKRQFGSDRSVSKRFSWSSLK
jgi:hypothetical protein